jgi:hypothetical protein
LGKIQQSAEGENSLLPGPSGIFNSFYDIAARAWGIFSCRIKSEASHLPSGRSCLNPGAIASKAIRASCILLQSPIR